MHLRQLLFYLLTVKKNLIHLEQAKLAHPIHLTILQKPLRYFEKASHFCIFV